MKRLLLACCIALPCLIISCTKDKAEENPEGPGGNPNPNPPGQELPEGVQRKAGIPIPGTLVQQQIGTQGGEIVLGNVKFVFPAGALDKVVTFKVQQLKNTAPNGIDSVAYRFETTGDVQASKPVKMIYTFPRDEENRPYIPGGDPKALAGVAIHKTENGSSSGVYIKQPGKPVINEAAGTATMDLPLKISNGKLDIISFLKYKLWINWKDGDTVSSTTVVCDDEIEYRVTCLGIDDIEDDLFVPLVDEKPVSHEQRSYITLIYVNGVPMGAGKPYGTILSNHKDNFFVYHAPYVVPGGADKTSKSFSISCDIDVIKNDVSKYYLVSNVKLINENTITIKGKTIVNVRASALEERGRKHISISLSNHDYPGTRAQASMEVNDVFAGIGNYEMNQPANLHVGASASYDTENWAASAPDPETNGLHQYGDGWVSIATYNRIQEIVKGSYAFTLVRTFNGKVERTLVTGKFHMPVTISN
jgi:hypothetical protein